MGVKIFLSATGLLLIFIGSSTPLDKQDLALKCLHTAPPSPRICHTVSRAQFPDESLLSAPYASLSFLLLFGSMIVLQPFNHQPLLRVPNVEAVSNPRGFSTHLSELLFHMLLWDPCAKTSGMAPKSHLRGWLLSSSLHACMAQEQLRQDFKWGFMAH